MALRSAGQPVPDDRQDLARRIQEDAVAAALPLGEGKPKGVGAMASTLAVHDFSDPWRRISREAIGEVLCKEGPGGVEPASVFLHLQERGRLAHGTANGLLPVLEG